MGVTRVAVIGLGRMGLPIARNLLERGFTVSGYRRTPGSELAGPGASVERSAADAAAHADVLLSIVPVDDVITGRTGKLIAMRPGTVHIEMSTIPVDRKRRLRDAVRAAGGDLLDCPISGSPGMVAPRLATTFASGDRGSVDAVSGVLDAIFGAVGLHRRVRDPGEHEVRRQYAARHPHGCGSRGDGAGQEVGRRSGRASTSAASGSPSGSRWRSRTASCSPGSPGRCSARSPMRSPAPRMT
jgi:6-phosphogluconate dehydrogenase (decarboxylating)